MRILLIGGGGREHALAWKLAQSPRLEALICAPGNPGTAACPGARNVAADLGDVDGLVGLARAERADLVVVGPEAPLAAGLADGLAGAGVPVFGPSQAAARLEASKSFAKSFMQRYGVPTGRFGVFDDAAAARAFLARMTPPYVIKADGLASGKGVVIAPTRDEAERTIAAFVSGRFKDASRTIVIEEFLKGEEASFFALSDGTDVVPLASAQDHKRALDGDEGPNTGGMGAYSPAPALTAGLQAEVMDAIVRPTIAGAAAEGFAFVGVLYVGLMLTASGPQVVEFNVRFGDPECQVLMTRLRSDLAPLLLAAATGELAAAAPPAWDPRPAVCVVMANRGYPGAVENGSVIGGVERAQALDDVVVFHAGTRADAGGVLRAHGGRVLGVTALGADLAAATKAAYAGVDAIRWPEGFCRRDIAWRALAPAGA